MDINSLIKHKMVDNYLKPFSKVSKDNQNKIIEEIYKKGKIF
jgi:hypothetical protein